MWKEFVLMFETEEDRIRYLRNFLIPETVRQRDLDNFHFYTYDGEWGLRKLRIRVEASKTQMREFEKRFRPSLKDIKGTYGVNLTYPGQEEINRFGGLDEWKRQMVFMSIGTMIFCQLESKNANPIENFPKPVEIYCLLHPLFNNSSKGYQDERTTYRECIDHAENGVWEQRVSKIMEETVKQMISIVKIKKKKAKAQKKSVKEN